MENHSEDKAKRILAIYTRLRQGKIVYKAAMSETYGVSQRTIQRDISDIQCFLQDQCMETGSIQEIIFDKQTGGYLLQTKQSQQISEKSVLVVCRILLESRAMVKTELFPIIQSLITMCGDGVKASLVKNILQDGMNQYIEPEHGRKLVEQLWILEQAVKAQKYIEIRYEDWKSQNEAAQKLKPVRVMFSEFNFYLIAYILGEKNVEKEGTSPVIYRIDKIQECMVTEEHFRIPYERVINGGEF